MKDTENKPPSEIMKQPPSAETIPKEKVSEKITDSNVEMKQLPKTTNCKTALEYFKSNSQLLYYPEKKGIEDKIISHPKEFVNQCK